MCLFNVDATLDYLAFFFRGEDPAVRRVDLRFVPDLSGRLTIVTRFWGELKERSDLAIKLQ